MVSLNRVPWSVFYHTCTGMSTEMSEINHSARVGSNEPGSVIWLAIPAICRKIHVVCWKNQIEVLTALRA